MFSANAISLGFFGVKYLLMDDETELVIKAPSVSGSVKDGQSPIFIGSGNKGVRVYKKRCWSCSSHGARRRECVATMCMRHVMPKHCEPRIN